MSDSNDAGPRDKRRAIVRAIALVTALAMVAIGCRPVVSALLAGGALDWLSQSSFYNRTVLSTNYFEDGFVRRGLGGTIAVLLSGDWLQSAALFTIASTVWLSAPLALLLLRLGRRTGIAGTLLFAAVIALSPQTFLGWRWDPARTDVLAAGFVAWATLAMVSRKVGVAVASVLVGLLVHEVALIFGAPLLFVLTRRLIATGELDRSHGLRAALALGAGAVAIMALQSLFSPPVVLLAQRMMEAGPPPSDPETLRVKSIAAYMQTAGLRGLRTAICFNAAGSPGYAVWAATGLVVLAAYAPMLLLRREWASFVLVAVAPALFLLVVANDAGRWIQLGVVNAWLFAVAIRCWAPPEEPSHRELALALVMLAILLSLGSARFDRVNNLPMMVAVALKLPPAPSFDATMQRCDPKWQAHLPKLGAKVFDSRVLP